MTETSTLRCVVLRRRQHNSLILSSSSCLCPTTVSLGGECKQQSMGQCMAHGHTRTHLNVNVNNNVYFAFSGKQNTWMKVKLSVIYIFLTKKLWMNEIKLNLIGFTLGWTLVYFCREKDQGIKWSQTNNKKFLRLRSFWHKDFKEKIAMYTRMITYWIIKHR